jgi:hypothetical protein
MIRVRSARVNRIGAILVAVWATAHVSNAGSIAKAGNVWTLDSPSHQRVVVVLGAASPVQTPQMDKGPLPAALILS